MKHDYEKVVRTCYPQKGLKMELREYYHPETYPHRGWRILIWNRIRTLISDGIWTEREEAYREFEELRLILKGS